MAKGKIVISTDYGLDNGFTGFYMFVMISLALFGAVHCVLCVLGISVVAREHFNNLANWSRFPFSD